jgi:hypothetical protein
MDDEEIIDQQVKLLATNRRTLARCREQLSMQGPAFALPGLLSTIADACESVRQIKHFLRSKNVEVQDLPIDEDIIVSSGGEVNSSSQASLLAKVQSRTVPLSQCIAEALVLAQKTGNTELADFCTRELVGLGDEPIFDPVAQKVEHRLIKGYFAPGQIDTRMYASVEQIFALMNSSDQVIEAWMPFREPISLIEHRRDNRPENGMLISKHRFGDVVPTASDPEVTIFWYGRPSAYVELIEAIRIELTKYLLR